MVKIVFLRLRLLDRSFKTKWSWSELRKQVNIRSSVARDEDEGMLTNLDKSDHLRRDDPTWTNIHQWRALSNIVMRDSA
jgi:hypothetical protein